MSDDTAVFAFEVWGTRRDDTTRAGGASAAPPCGLRGTLSASVSLGATREAGAPIRLEAVSGRDIVVLHLANGPSLVLHPATARDLLLAQRSDATPRGAATTALEVPTQLRWQGLEAPAIAARGATRGWLGDVLLAGIDIVTGHVRERAVAATVAALIARIDGQVDEGVYPLTAAALGTLKGQPQVTRPIGGDGPCLVFVHGTFSDTAGTFGKLWARHPQEVGVLFAHYRARVYALDHRTLGASPLDNALSLVRQCAHGARLHLVTHSRGGLVAEVLVRAGALAAPGADDDAHFAAADLASQRAALAELITEMRARDVRITRVVRVACPARGTLLAGRRLDAYLSVFRWALDLAQVPVLPALVEFIGAVAQQRTDPTVLPGVAAMVPDSALVQWLHAAAAPLDSELRVIAGDLAADSLGSWIKTLMSDAFFWTDHDLVVQTSSMYGGAPRARDAGFVFDRGGRVSHFNYFANDRTVAALVEGLVSDRPVGYRPIGPLSYAGESASGIRAAARAARGAGRAASDLPAVFVLPGILGSHLKVDGQRVWLGVRLVNGLQKLAYPEPAGTLVEPDGPVGLSYDDLMDYLADTHEVIEFAYDWRRPIEDEAARLGRAIDLALTARAGSGQPVRLLAHSMGGVVARTVQLEMPAVWERMLAHPGARVLMLGTPNGGSWAPMQVLSGDDTFGNALVAFGAPFRTRAARDLMARFPGFMQLQANLLDPGAPLHLADTWRDLATRDWDALRTHVWWHRDPLQADPYLWGIPPQDVLDRAVALRRRLDAQSRDVLPAFAARMLLVTGRAEFTPDGYTIGPEGLTYLNAVQAGDGRVTLAQARLPGVRTYTLDCAHGALPAAHDAFPAYLDLLETGTTTRLTALPAMRDSTPAPVHAPSRPARRARSLAMPESSEALLRSDTGVREMQPPPRALAVTVLNADLQFVREPLLIGHYHTHTLTGSERVVNLLIGGTMAESLGLGQYPDDAGTHQVFANRGAHRDNPLALPRPECVVVVGLGAEGKLRPNDLRYTVRLGVLALAQRLVERATDTPVQFDLAATLLGSGGVGISAGQSAQLVAQGVRDADLALHELNERADGPPRWPRVGQLRLVELYLDRATEAWHALRVLSAATQGAFAIGDEVRRDASALVRPIDGGYRGADYDLISAVADEDLPGDHRILYTIDTRRARTEVRAQSTQARLVRELVAHASNDRQADPQIGRTLFQLLVPVELEPYLGASSEMLLELDRGTAGIPWELLEPAHAANGGDAGDRRPWAIRSRLLRKLRLDDYRQQVVDATPDAHVLVIGEPRCDDARYPRLPGARAEAQAVHQRLLESGALGSDRVTALVGPDPAAPGPGAREVINALMARDWRIVHIAGHGEPPEITPAAEGGSRVRDPRGVVLSDGTFLGPREIRNMRVVPELVFVNCCHLAAIPTTVLDAEPSGRYDRAAFAAGVAEELIRIGVRCVVAAGWAVEDLPAATFATTFYDALLRGARFIEAVSLAREAAHAAGGNTWAAYQCYGDPDWTLRHHAARVPRAAQASLAEEFDGIASPPALHTALETLAVQSRFQHAAAERQAARLRYLEARFAGWTSRGDTACLFGEAWHALGDRPSAIAWYARALAAADATAPLKASEQLANLRVREAWSEVATAQRGDRAQGGARPSPAVRDAIAAARSVLAAELARLDQLLGIHETAERYALRASAFKRLAMLERAAGRRRPEEAALARMAADYAAAEHHAHAAEDADAALHAALNRLAAEVAQHAGDARRGPEAATFAALEQALAAEVRAAPDFWNVAATSELRLLRALAVGDLAGTRESLAREFTDLHQRVPAPLKWASVADQLAFVLPPYVARVRRADERAAAAALVTLVEGYAQCTPAQ